ncbi:DUF983 domain-containing protein [Novosphingobium sp. 9U]|uniref:DUF983 domain-containing protein n=1 Tax=Novosphingobium sp. 9U TaxID=2653158 RepID=UPI0012F449D2|nr:DUF983 domain-containing protein [Novosphingobium sp. 9U]VWX49665.1 conserved hypothetical protein [Novosphingobium sp. 9U]
MTSAAAAPPGIALPASFWQAAQRGALCRCPRCGEARLFTKWLKPAAHCPACGQDWSHQRADDFPAYLAILVTGHVLAPIMIALALDTELPPAAILALLVPSSVAMMLGMLQPAKGAVIAAQWWHGLHGFTKERAGERPGAKP